MIRTFDIWLEDSQGRQFRRSNHYADKINCVEQPFLAYAQMLYDLSLLGIDTDIQVCLF